MKLSRTPLLMLLLAISSAQVSNNLESQMGKLHVETALLVPSQGVDEFPVWSPDSRFLAVNLEGKWFNVDTQRVKLREATWHGNRVGVVSPEPAMASMNTEQVADWAKHAVHAESVLTTKSGLKVEMTRSELSTSLVVSQAKHSSVIWKSGMETCGELSVSPNSAFLAYICELNGVLVMDLKQLVRAARHDN